MKKPKLRELKEAITALVKGPYTSKFPKVAPTVPEHFRGTPTYVPDECVGCGSCGQVCPAGAITFGDLNAPHHKVYKLKKDPNAFRLLEKLGTNPKVYYVSTTDWVRKASDAYTGKQGEGVTPG